MIEKKEIYEYLKNNGFLIKNAEIYQGLENSWDLGPYGVELKRNIKKLWWKYFITSEPYNVGTDTLIITHPSVLKSSGHLKNFCDWVVECKNCLNRYRLDKIVSKDIFSNFLSSKSKENFSFSEKCEKCNKVNFFPPYQVNLMFYINLKKGKDKKIAYLRPETCQGIFINLFSVKKSVRKKFPFGIGQIGKSFRNETTLKHGIFRTREFEQMELEFFYLEENEREKWWKYWENKSWNFLQKIIQKQENIKKVNLNSYELPHYAKKTLDLYFKYHFGWGELCSNSDRDNYDLLQHSKYYKKWEGKNNEISIPRVIEVSFGVERIMLAILEDSFETEKENLKRNYNFLKINPLFSPFFAAIMPYSKKLKDKSYDLYLKLLSKFQFNITFEEGKDIRECYKRQDIIGTYFCLTFDFQSLKDEKVTIRERDSRIQIRLNISSIEEVLEKKYNNFFKIFFNNL